MMHNPPEEASISQDGTERDDDSSAAMDGYLAERMGLYVADDVNVGKESPSSQVATEIFVVKLQYSDGQQRLGGEHYVNTSSDGSSISLPQKDNHEGGGAGSEIEQKVPDNVRDDLMKVPLSLHSSLNQQLHVPLPSRPVKRPHLRRGQSAPHQSTESMFRDSHQMISHTTYRPVLKPYSRGHRRREVMGLSLFARNSCIQPVDSLESDGDVSFTDEQSSVNSEEALELRAMQIRSELRHFEMVEFAVEAEKAAALGEERFSAMASTFGAGLGDEDSPVYVTHRPIATKPRRGLLRRHVSYSEGTRLPLRTARTRDRVGILNLRDVHDVVPLFAQFHVNLRTQYTRNTTRSDIFLFKENARLSQRLPPPPERRELPAPGTCVNGRKAFLNNFRIDRWVAPALQPSQSLSIDTPSSLVGDLLSEHIHRPDDEFSRPRPLIDVPFGLDVPDFNLSGESAVGSRRRSSTLPMDLPSRKHKSSINDESSPEYILPRALFDQDDDADSDADSVELDAPVSLDAAMRPPSTPLGSRSIKAIGQDFQTPVRLRNMRGNKPDYDVSERTLFAVNSMLQHTPTELMSGPELSQTDTFDEAQVKRVVTETLFIPRDHARKFIHFQPLSSGNLSVQGDAALIDTQHSSVNYASASQPEKKDPVCTGTLAEVSTLHSTFDPTKPPLCKQELSETARSVATTELGSDFSATTSNPLQHVSNISRHVIKNKARRVKVSVYGCAPGPQQLSPEGQEKVLQETRVISIEDGNQCAASEKTPPRVDCECLVSATSSIDTTDSLCADDRLTTKSNFARDRLASVPLSTVDEEEREKQAWNPFIPGTQNGGKFNGRKHLQAAMDMLSDLSPRHGSRQAELRRRCVPQADNDAFLHNYLYNSKPAVKGEERKHMCVEPCRDSRLPCADSEFSTDNCCVSFLSDTAITILPRRGSRHNVHLSRSSSNSKAETDSWFDAANERFDGMIEHIMGRRKNNEWNIAFEAPSLKKHVGGEDRENIPFESQIQSSAVLAVDQGSEDNLDEKKMDDTSSSPFRAEARQPQALFNKPSDSMSDTEFQLIYGRRRDQISSSRIDPADNDKDYEGRREIKASMSDIADQAARLRDFKNTKAKTATFQSETVAFGLASQSF